MSVIAEGEESTTWFVWLLVLCTSISGLLFGMIHYSLDSPRAHVANIQLGYDTGVISGALVTIGSDLGPTELSSGQKVCESAPKYPHY